MTNEKIRFNFMISTELKEWVDEQAAKTGMSQSAFVNLCVANQKQNSETLDAMKNVTHLIEELKTMQNDIKENAR